MNHRIWKKAALVALVCTGCASSSTQGTKTVPGTASEEQTPKSQVDQGALIYAQSCAGCHGDAGQGSEKGPPIVGEGALPLDPRSGQKRGIQFHTALDVYQWTHDHMPPKKPGSLTDDQYLAVVAFALAANGVDLDGGTLSADVAATIVLHDDAAQP